MHAIDSGIMGESEYLYETSALNTTSQSIYNACRPKLDRGIQPIYFDLQLSRN